MNKYKRVLFVSLLFSVVAQAFGPPEGVRESQSFIAGDFRHNPRVIVSFGDSIASGFNSQSWFHRVDGGTYADRLGKRIHEKTGCSVHIKNQARAGYYIKSIHRLMSKKFLHDVQSADILLLEGGGNDLFLAADFCREKSYRVKSQQVIRSTRQMLDLVAAEKQEHAQVILVGIYYPDLNKKRKLRCSREAKDVEAAHLRALQQVAQVNWVNRRYAQAKGFQFADSFAKLNCPLAGQNLCQISRAASLAQYQRNILNAYKKSYIVDLFALGYSQADGVHPNTWGHDAIASLLL